MDNKTKNKIRSGLIGLGVLLAVFILSHVWQLSVHDGNLVYAGFDQPEATDRAVNSLYFKISIIVLSAIILLLSGYLIRKITRRVPSRMNSDKD